ncbi:hypothetical protein [uncultured Flavobacterium sp.]|uniref:hypothetical protein n=1 Tax=uncultured Flavobacterium sp. TaxID=165435 RepID=UPI0030CA3BA9
MFNKIKFKIMKLSLDALKERAEATASTELMATISGGTANECHIVDGGTLPEILVTAPRKR